MLRPNALQALDASSDVSMNKDIIYGVADHWRRHSYVPNLG